MNSNDQQTPSSESPQPAQQQNTAERPHDVGGIYYSTRIKISDPQSGEVILQIRGDA